MKLIQLLVQLYLFVCNSLATRINSKLPIPRPFRLFQIGLNRRLFFILSRNYICTLPDCSRNISTYIPDLFRCFFYNINSFINHSLITTNFFKCMTSINQNSTNCFVQLIIVNMDYSISLSLFKFAILTGQEAC